ncbi:YdcF family protein [Phaeacidiphilus oryzae]|uniref:YdcF family protein n=1 Tax=Phaeacidiphilus oryzae TaxID=348818 RepID=UPI000B193751|nr:YdcF family protein [Phaeacidiphilus oryzae]
MPVSVPLLFLLYPATLFWLIVFTVATVRDRRRLRNAVYLFFLVLCALLSAFDTLRLFLPEGAVLLAVLLVLALVAAVVLLAVFLICNGVTMVRREGLRPANLLSLLVGLGMVGYGVFFAICEWIDSLPLHALQVVLVVLLAYVSFLFSSFLLYSLFYARLPYWGRVDAVIVLGSGLIGSRVPPLLASRLDRGRAEFEKAEAKAAGKAGQTGQAGQAGQAGQTGQAGQAAAPGQALPVIVVSGGQGPGEDLPEAHAMADYLIAAGVPAERVVREDRSTTTAENLRFSKEILDRSLPEGYRCLVVTNNYHVLRAALTARRVRIRSEVVGSPTARYFWPSAVIREFVAIVMAKKGLNLLVCGLLMLGALLSAA